MLMKDWNQLKAELLQNKAVKKEYDRLTPLIWRFRS